MTPRIALFGTILRLALLGAVRHYKRSLVVFFSIATASAFMVAVGSLLNGITESFFASVVPNSGHVRIDDGRAAMASNPFDPAFLVPGADGILEAIAALGDPRIVAAEPVLGFGALLVESTAGGAEESRNLAMRGLGVRPDTRFADNVRYSMREGSFLPEGRGILVSERAAALLGSRLGEGLLVLVQDRSGQPWYEELPITGLFETESRDFDESTFYVEHDRAAEMLDAQGSTREIRLLLADRDDAEALMPAVTAAARSAATEATASTEAVPRLRVMAWRSINASVLTILIFIKIMLGVVVGLFAVVAATLIANTVLQSVFERLREFGTMRAIGLRARRLRSLVLAEGAIVGLAGSLVGLALGIAGVYALAGDGLDLGGIMESVGLSRYNRPHPDLLYFAFCTIASVCVSLVATSQGARAVARKSVAESLGATQ